MWTVKLSRLMERRIEQECNMSEIENTTDIVAKEIYVFKFILNLSNLFCFKSIES